MSRSLGALCALVLFAGCGDEDWEGAEPGECLDLADNDGDGLFDCQDPDCFGAVECQGTVPTVPGPGTGTGTGTGTGSTTTTTTFTTGTTGTTAPTQFTVTISWNDDGGLAQNGSCDDSVDITILDPLLENQWRFGMAETGASGWTGEDCFNGYAQVHLCHAIQASDTVLERPDCGIPTMSGWTLFSAEFEPYLTYMLEDSQGACFTFGDDPGYYAALGCTQMN